MPYEHIFSILPIEKKEERKIHTYIQTSQHKTPYNCTSTFNTTVSEHNPTNHVAKKKILILINNIKQPHKLPQSAFFFLPYRAPDRSHTSTPPWYKTWVSRTVSTPQPGLWTPSRAQSGSGSRAGRRWPCSSVLISAAAGN